MVVAPLRSTRIWLSRLFVLLNWLLMLMMDARSKAQSSRCRISTGSVVGEGGVGLVVGSDDPVGSGAPDPVGAALGAPVTTPSASLPVPSTVVAQPVPAASRAAVSRTGSADTRMRTNYRPADRVTEPGEPTAGTDSATER